MKRPSVAIPQTAPVLAEAADVLSDQLRILLKKLSKALLPESAGLESAFLAWLRRQRFNVVQRKALCELTLGAAARVLSKRGTSPSDFFESVEYHGRRLAKLNLPPNVVVSALAEYDALLSPVLKRLLPAEYGNFQWVREQLQFCVMLTLNNAYYHVREAETQAFYEMFWAELEAASLDDLLGRFLAILARFSRADQAALYLVEQDAMRCRARVGATRGAEDIKVTATQLRQLAAPRSVAAETSNLSLDRRWRETFATCWSVPMLQRGSLAGVVQFAFPKRFDWLPRERELLMAAAERCMRAAEKARMVENLAEKERTIRKLAESMMHVEEVERRRISRELHDQTGQDLLWIRLQMEMLEKELPDGGGQWRSRVGQLRDMTERTIVEVRRLIGALSPAVLEQLGLAAALRQLANRFRMSHPARVRVAIGPLEPLPKQLEMIAYRIVQECLNNISKHSSCKAVNISMETADGLLRLSVQDDGVGFDVETTLRQPGGFGLSGIRERVALLGGTFDIRSRAGKPGQVASRRRSGSGTEIRVSLPIQSAMALRKGPAKMARLAVNEALWAEKRA